jgi:hypothetical protein
MGEIKQIMGNNLYLRTSKRPVYINGTGVPISAIRTEDFSDFPLFFKSSYGRITIVYCLLGIM